MVFVALIFSLPFGHPVAGICPDSTPEEFLAGVETQEPAPVVDWITAGMLAGDWNVGMVVDVRSAADRQMTRIPVALEIDLLQLRGMVGKSGGEFVVIGAGYDDQQLARRISSWPEAAGKVRIVHGGVAAWLLSQPDPVSDVALENALGVPAGRVAGLVMQPDWKILPLDETGRSSAENLLPESTALPAPDSKSLSELAARLQDAGLSDHHGLLLMDGDGQQSASDAVQLSRLLERPVFYAQGGATAVESEILRFADINRQPAGLSRGCR